MDLSGSINGTFLTVSRPRLTDLSHSTPHRKWAQRPLVASETPRGETGMVLLLEARLQEELVFVLLVGSEKSE